MNEGGRYEYVRVGLMAAIYGVNVNSMHYTFVQVKQPLFDYLNGQAQKHGQKECPVSKECGKCVCVDGHAKVGSSLVLRGCGVCHFSPTVWAA